MVPPPGRRELSSLFRLCNHSALDDLDNRRLFAGDGVVFLPVQSNDPACALTDGCDSNGGGCDNCDIAAICRTLLGQTEQLGADPVVALAALSLAQRKGEGVHSILSAGSNRVSWCVV